MKNGDWAESVVKEKVQNIVRQVAKGNTESIDDNSGLFTDGYLDSLNVLEIIELLENQFSICFDPEELTDKNFFSIASICQLILNRLND